MDSALGLPFIAPQDNLSLPGALYLIDIASVASVREGFGSPFFLDVQVRDNLPTAIWNRDTTGQQGKCLPPTSHSSFLVTQDNPPRNNRLRFIKC